MKISITPGKAKGNVLVPPSKSVSHRALICGAFSEKSSIKNIAYSEDIKATIGALKALGAKVEEKENEVIIGSLLKEPLREKIINCKESGSTLRFIVPIALLFKEEITLKGEGRLLNRPQNVFSELFEDKSVLFLQNEDEIKVKGKLESGKYYLKGNVSSQFISGLLFALPNIEGKSEIHLTTNLESASYIDLTRAVLSDFGIETSYENGIFSVEKGEFLSREYEVEGDYSNAAVFFLLNAIGGNIEIKGLNEKSLQGDRVIASYLNSLKTFENKPLDLSDCPDLAPILFAAAAVFGGGEFIGTKRLKLKESDRIETMKTELKKFGINLIEKENSVIIEKGVLSEPKEPLFGHNDHRIVMALSVLLSITGGEIEGAAAVTKSFPDFFVKLKSLGINLKEI